MTEARITQLVQQAPVQANPEARVTQEVVQGLVQGDPEARVTQLVMQALVKVKPPRPTSRARETQTSTTSDRYSGVDPFWKNVVFLVHGDSGLRDRSNFHAPGIGARGRGPFPDPSNPRFGASLWHSSVHGHGARWFPPNRNRYALANRPFTIEAWVRAPLAGGPRGIVGVYTTQTNDRGWALLLESNVIRFYASLDGSAADLNLAGTTLVANTWTHICVERDHTGKVRMYVNGAMVSFANFPHKINAPDIPLTIMKHGWDSEEMAGRCLNGYVNDIRITKGVARYASDAGFTVPTAARPYKPFTEDLLYDDPYWDNVTCLVNCQQNPIVDLKRNATVTGVTQRTYLNEGDDANQIFSGSGSIAHVDSQWDLVGRPEPFTFEFDMNCDRGGNPSPIIWSIANSLRLTAGRGGWGVSYWNGSSWVGLFAAGHYFSGLVNGTAMHSVHISRDEFGVWRCWNVGVLVGEVLQPANMTPAPNTNLTIDNQSQGYLDNIRMTWGVARYNKSGPIEDPQHAFPYRLSGPPAPPAPALSFPYDLGFPKPEQGGSWTTLLGSSPRAVDKFVSGIPDTAEPDFFRWTAGPSARVRNQRPFYIPPQLHADIDAGLVYLDFGGRGAAFRDQPDRGAIVAGAYTSFNGSATRRAVSNVVSAKEFTPLEGRLWLPPGTRVVAVGFIAFNNASSSREFIYRDVYARLTKDEPVTRYDLPVPQLADWVDAKGGTVSAVTGAETFQLPTFVANGKTADLRATFDLPSTIHDEIDAGEAAFRLEALTFLNTADTGDFGRVYFEFLDGSDAVVGRRLWDFPHPYIPDTLQKTDIAAPIPAGARKAVIGLFGSKDYDEGGTSRASFQPAIIQAHCYLPAPGQMPAAVPAPPMPTEDEHWEKVRLLLSTRNGVIENLAPVDTRRIQANGNVAVASIDSPFGTTAIRSNLAGASIGTDWLEVELYGPDIGPAMTVEAWFMKTARSARQWDVIHNQLGAGADQPANPMRMDGAARSDVQLAFNEWYHVALCRNADGRGRVFVNGKRQLTESNLPGLLWNRLFRLFVYDAGSITQSSWCGYIDEFRITEGVERYTEDFVPQETRFPIRGPDANLLLSGAAGRLLLTGDDGGLLLNGDDYGR